MGRVPARCRQLVGAEKPRQEAAIVTEPLAFDDLQARQAAVSMMSKPAHHGRLECGDLGFAQLARRCAISLPAIPRHRALNRLRQGPARLHAERDTRLGDVECQAAGLVRPIAAVAANASRRARRRLARVRSPGARSLLHGYADRS